MQPVVASAARAIAAMRLMSLRRSARWFGSRAVVLLNVARLDHRRDGWLLRPAAKARRETWLNSPSATRRTRHSGSLGFGRHGQLVPDELALATAEVGPIHLLDSPAPRPRPLGRLRPSPAACAQPRVMLPTACAVHAESGACVPLSRPRLAPAKPPTTRHDPGRSALDRKARQTIARPRRPVRRLPPARSILADSYCRLVAQARAFDEPS
jgi:hypothetical protein